MAAIPSKARPDEPRKKRGRHQPQPTNQEQAPVKSNSGRSLRNQVRGVERLLLRELNDEARAVQEAKLQSLKKQMEEKTKSEQERKYALRYRRVRFTERIKLTRRLVKAQKSLEDWRAEHGATAISHVATMLEGQIAAAHEDLEYVLNFPKDEKYVSLLVDPSQPEDLERVNQERVRLRTKVKEMLASQPAVKPPTSKTFADAGSHKTPSREATRSSKATASKQKSVALPVQGTKGLSKKMGKPPAVHPDDMDTMAAGRSDDERAEEEGLSSENDGDDPFFLVDDTHAAAPVPVALPPSATRPNPCQHTKESKAQARCARAVEGQPRGSSHSWQVRDTARPRGIPAKVPTSLPAQPVRTRAEGGRKRRKKE